MRGLLKPFQSGAFSTTPLKEKRRLTPLISTNGWSQSLVLELLGTDLLRTDLTEYLADYPCF
jgi:hypothetical protein